MRARPILIGLALGLLAVLVAAGWWLYTPDKDRVALEATYAQPPSQFIDVAGVRLHVRDTGPRDAPALIMLHGFASSLQTWDGWSDALSGQYRMVRFDLPGFGLTGPDPSGDYSDERSIAIVAALMDRLGLTRATLVGNSMGGNIAWRFAAAHPDRTAKLVLVSPAGFPPPNEARAQGSTRPTSLPFTIRMMRYVLPMPVLRMNMQASYADPSRLTPQLMTRYRDMLLVPGIRSAILSRMLQTNWPDPVPILRSIQTPTLLIWGENDRLIPFRNSADYMAALPHATLAPLPGQGHVPQEEVSDMALAPLRAFLAS